MDVADFQPSVLIQLELTIGSEGIMLSVKEHQSWGMEVWCYLTKERKTLSIPYKYFYSCRKKAFICYEKVQSVMHSEIPSILRSVIIWWLEWKKGYNSFCNKNLLQKDSSMGLLRTTEYITSKVSWRYYKCMAIILSYINIFKSQREMSQKFVCFLMLFSYIVLAFLL